MRRVLLHNFHHAPLNMPALNQSAVDVINRRRAAGVIVAVAANGKGGCGKSTFLLNAAIGYAKMGKRVLVIDADTEQKTASKWPRSEWGGKNPTVISSDTVGIIGELAKLVGA